MSWRTGGVTRVLHFTEDTCGAISVQVSRQNRGKQVLIMYSLTSDLPPPLLMAAPEVEAVEGEAPPMYVVTHVDVGRCICTRARASLIYKRHHIVIGPV